MSKIQKNFFSGALILTVANLVVKVIGAVYKIPLANLIDTEGMNYYNDAYQIYALLFVISTAGVPVAIAKMVSEAVVQKRLYEPKKILHIALRIFAAIGFVLAALVIIFARQISTLLSNDSVNYCLYMIAPSIFLVIISATIKGYFQGYKCMTPSAVYQVIEAAFKLLGLVIIYVMIRRGVTDVMILACGGVLGVTIGSFASAVFMTVRVLCEKELGADKTDSLPSHDTKTIVNSIISLAIPISLSSSVMSVTATLDMMLVKKNLTHFYSRFEMVGDKLKTTVLETYGAYVGSTSSLFNLPQAVIVTVGIAVLPFLTSAYAANDKPEAYKNMRSSSKLVGLIGMPCTVGMSVLAEPIIMLLYKQSYWDVGISTLRVLALSVYFVSFVSLTDVFLQAIGKVNTALLSMGIGAVMKIVTNIVMVRLVGIMGAPIGTFACYLSISIINMIFIKKYVGFTFPVVDTFIKPLICSLICGAAGYGSWRILCAVGLSSRLALVPAILIAVVAHAAAIIIFRVLSPEDLKLLPKGDKLCAVMRKKGLINE